MLRDRQEKEQLVRKFEEIVPILKNYDNFGWYVPSCDKDPVYKIYPDWFTTPSAPFKIFAVNVKTGWHSEIVYRDELGIHRIKEGITPISDDWRDTCYKSCCSGQATITIRK